MQCPHCNHMIPDASRYCAYCGVTQARPQLPARGWSLWAVALLMLAGLGGGWLLGGGARPAPTPQVIEKVVTQVVFATPGPSPTPRPPTAAPAKPPEPTKAPAAQTALPPTPAPGAGPTQVSDKDGMAQVYVPAGEFTMGSADGDGDAYSNEKPQHKVTLDAFWIDRTEVTNAQYRKCVAAGACQPPSESKSYTRSSYYGNAEYDNYPVIYVSWDAAQKYCQWAGRRLPTEAEWEKAARGADGWKYPWGDAAPDNQRANFNRNKGDTTVVGSYPTGASPYGALDMAGNVWEWAADWYNETYYQGGPAQNPPGPGSGNARVLRGSSWDDGPGIVRAANRVRGAPGGVNSNVGFRCARS